MAIIFWTLLISDPEIYATLLFRLSSEFFLTEMKFQNIRRILKTGEKRDGSISYLEQIPLIIPTFHIFQLIK